MADFEKMYFELFNGITMLLNNSKSFSKRLKSSTLSTKKRKRLKTAPKAYGLSFGGEF